MKIFKNLVFSFIIFLFSCGSENDSQPNIVFILTDDLGYSDIGAYGAEIIATPNIDKLAEGGLRYTNFYNTGRCWPTRTSLLSGFYPHQVLTDRVDGVDYKNESVQSATNTWLPGLLQNHGYRTYHSGKWHIQRVVPAWKAVDYKTLGFDRSYQTEDGRHLRPTRLIENGEKIPVPPPGVPYEANIAIVDHGIKYLEEHRKEHSEKSFFQYLAFITPHFPLQALQEDIDAYKDLFSEGWNEIRLQRTANREDLGFNTFPVNAFEPERFAPWNLSYEELIAQIDPNDINQALPWNELSSKQKEFQALKMAIHAAMITRMDREIGRYIAKLEEEGLLENTIIFFCSDNGASTEIMNRHHKHHPGAVPGDENSYVCLGPGWSTAANTPFRLHKTWLHEGGIATPFIVHWPAGIKDKGVFRSMPHHIIDIAPTLLELAGGEKEELDSLNVAPGQSMLPTFNQDINQARDPIFFHHENKKALRDGNWKIVTVENGADWELYDLSTDRGETNDLSQAKPEKLKEMVELWNARKNEIVTQIKD